MATAEIKGPIGNIQKNLELRAPVMSPLNSDKVRKMFGLEMVKADVWGQ